MGDKCQNGDVLHENKLAQTIESNLLLDLQGKGRVLQIRSVHENRNNTCLLWITAYLFLLSFDASDAMIIPLAN